METQSNQRMEIGGTEMNAEEFLKEEKFTTQQVGDCADHIEWVLLADAFEAVRIAKAETGFPYLSEAERKELGAGRLLQYVLGIESCKTKGEVVDMLKEVEDAKLQEVREWLETVNDIDSTDRASLIGKYQMRFLNKESEKK